MESTKKNYSREADFKEGDVERAQAIVAEKLGEGFCLEVGFFPKNVGIKGDQGVLGETVMIVGEVERPAYFMTENQELLDEVASKLAGEIDAITKVLFEIAKRQSSSEIIIPKPDLL